MTAAALAFGVAMFAACLTFVGWLGQQAWSSLTTQLAGHSAQLVSIDAKLDRGLEQLARDDERLNALENRARVRSVRRAEQ